MAVVGSQAEGGEDGENVVLQLPWHSGPVNAVQVDAVFALPLPHYRGGYVDRERQRVKVGSLLP